MAFDGSQPRIAADGTRRLRFAPTIKHWSAVE